MRLVLASASPRRRQLMTEAGFAFEVVTSHVDESILDIQEPAELVSATALLKAKAVAHKLWEGHICLGGADPSACDGLIIAADTMVFVGKERLGKPRDRMDAYRMMQLLSGATHQVITAVTLVTPACGALRAHRDVCVEGELCTLTYYETSLVEFKKLTDQEIDTYLDTAHWQDKAGAYGIQEDAGGFVTRVDGDFHNIMGLPLSWVSTTLHSLGLRSCPHLPRPLQRPMIINGAKVSVSIYPKTGEGDGLKTPFGISLKRPPILLIMPSCLDELTKSHEHERDCVQALEWGLHQTYANTHTVIAAHLPNHRLDHSSLSIHDQAQMIVELLDRLGIPETRLLYDRRHQHVVDACYHLRGFRFSAAVMLDMDALLTQLRAVINAPIGCLHPSSVVPDTLGGPNSNTTCPQASLTVDSATPQSKDVPTWGRFLSTLLQTCAPGTTEYEVIPASLKTSPFLSVRLLNDGDRAKVQACYHQLLIFLEEHTNYCGWKLGLYPTAAQIDRALDNATLYGAFDIRTGALVGAASFACDTPDYYDACGWVKRDQSETMMVHMLMTDPDAGRKGVARTLLAFGATHAKQHGCVELRLNTSVQNVLSSRLYERLGFVRCYPLLLPYPDLDIADWTCVYTLPLTSLNQGE